MLLYATGLRRTEAATLKVSEVDSSLMLIHLTSRQRKAAGDRELPLTQKLLDALRAYGRASSTSYPAGFYAYATSSCLATAGAEHCSA